MPRAESVARRGEETRAAILAAALECFGRSGYRGTSIADIAHRCGIVQSAVQHHFGSKENLLMALLDRYFPPAGALRDVSGTSVGPEETLARLRSVIRTNTERQNMVRFYSVMLGESLTDEHPAQQFFAARFAASKSLVEAMLGPEDSDTRADTAALLIAAMDGLQLQWLLNPTFDMEAAFSRLALRSPAITHADG